MNIIINGKITEMLDPRVDISKKNGSKWISQTIIVDDKDRERYAINILGETFLKKLNLKVGEIASFTCKMNSSEWQGKWFTNLKLEDIIIQRFNTTQKQDTFNINVNDKVDVNTLPF